MDIIFGLESLETVYQRKHYSVFTIFYDLPVTDYKKVKLFFFPQYNNSFIFIMQKYHNQENMKCILF